MVPFSANGVTHSIETDGSPTRHTDGQMARRLTQLLAGLVLYGVSLTMILLSALGNSPWDVLHQGLSRSFGLGTGTWVIIVGAVLLLLWIPLRQRPGIGTISNVIVVGVIIDLLLPQFEEPSAMVVRVALLLIGILLCGIATGLYIGADFGPGPRDGLMTGLADRGISIRVARTGIEVFVLATGWALGGTIGVGTLIFAFAIGPLAHIFLPIFDVRRTRRTDLPDVALP